MRRFIPVEEVAKKWMKDPLFVAAYDALEGEFAVASALIKARGKAAMTQEEVARAMGTTQAVVARLESGRTMPSTRTLERFAKATHTRLRISFEPVKPGQSAAGKYLPQQLRPLKKTPQRKRLGGQRRRSG
jgi:transcriptional regulator with XRE-family HTH domain